MTKFNATKSAEKKLAVQLRKVAKATSNIINSYEKNGIIVDQGALDKALFDYAELITPWAENITSKILESVNRNNERDWKSTVKVLSSELKKTIENAEIGLVMRTLQKEQVELIKSLPIDAGVKAQQITREAIATGERVSSSSQKILQLGDITANRATLIARTETAKANAILTQARAESVGATHYIWRTMEDASVRESHAVMEGKIHRFDTPPFIQKEGNHGPGMFPNCRCYPEPIITF